MCISILLFYVWVKVNKLHFGLIDLKFYWDKVNKWL